MTEVYLHGILSKKFRKKYLFDISRPEDVFKAIDSCSPNFIKFLQNNVDTMDLSVLIDKKVVSPDSFGFRRDQSQRIDLVPVCCGGFLSALGWFVVGLLARF